MIKKALLVSLIALCGISVQAQSWKKLHRKAVLVDTHNDVISEVILKGLNIEEDLTGKAHSDLARFRKGGVDVQMFSIFCDQRFGKDTAFKHANLEIDSLLSIISRHPSQLMLVSSPSQLETALKQKKMACMIGVEGGHMIEDSIAYLEALAARGMRYLTLTWNNSTSWATSAADESKGLAPFGSNGLTAKGKDIVRRMNQLGVMIDVSHVGEQTFADAISTSSKPVIASHSCVHQLCPVPRNLKDDQIRAIGKNGGVIQLNFYSGFLDSNYLKRKAAFLAAHSRETDSLKALKLPNYQIDDVLTRKYPAEANALRPPLSILFDHIDYLVKLVGIDHVGLGSDFDGIESAPQGLDGVQDFPRITRGLKERGYSNADIRKILGENFLRVFRANSENL